MFVYCFIWILNNQQQTNKKIMDSDDFEDGADMCRRMKRELKDRFFGIMEQLFEGTDGKIRDKVMFDFVIGCEILTASATILDATKDELNTDRIYFSVRKSNPNVKTIPSLRIKDKEISFHYNHQLIPLCLEMPQNHIVVPGDFCKKFWEQTGGCRFTLVDLLLLWMTFAGFHNHDAPGFIPWTPPFHHHPSMEKNMTSTHVPDATEDDWEKSSEDETLKGKPTAEEVEKRKKEKRMEKHNEEKKQKYMDFLEQQRVENEMDNYDEPVQRERVTAEQKSNESALGWIWSTLLRK